MSPQPDYLSYDQAHFAYMLAWLSFAMVHSWLAGPAMKDRFETWFGPQRRLIYNLIAAVHFAFVIAIGYGAFHGMPPFAILLNYWESFTMASLTGWTMLFLILRKYDLGRFSGLAQIKAARQGKILREDEPLITTGYHAFVRHPLYSAGFLILWGAAWSDFGLATAVWGSAYLIIGSRFEEKRLRRLYGEAYQSYRKQVPAFIPYKGRVKVTPPRPGPANGQPWKK